MDLNIIKRKTRGVIAEYLILGREIGMFSDETIDNIYGRLNCVQIVEDNTIPGDAKATFENGSPVIIINRERCEKTGKEYFMDEVLFHELSHIANEVFRDFYVYQNSRIMSFYNKYSEYSENNDLTKYPFWGMILVDETICQYTAQKMVERKYGDVYTEKFVKTTLTEPEMVLSTELADYMEAYKFVDLFSKTVYKDENPIFRLCKDAFNDNLMDNINYRYKKRENGMKELYEILGYMGNIGLAYYSKYHNFNIENTEINKDKKMVLKSMHTIMNKTNEIIKKEN